VKKAFVRELHEGVHTYDHFKAAIMVNQYSLKELGKGGRVLE